MSVELPASVEKELRDLAVTQNRDLSDLVEEAVRQYIEAAAITDLGPEEVSEANSSSSASFGISKNGRAAVRETRGSLVGGVALTGSR